MKKNIGKEFFKSRGFYVTLALGVVAVLGIGALGLNLYSTNQNNGQIQQEEPLAKNEPDYDIAENMDSAKKGTNENSIENQNEKETEEKKEDSFTQEQQLADSQQIGETELAKVKEGQTEQAPVDLTGDAEENVLSKEDQQINDALAKEEEEAVAVLNQDKKSALSFSEDKGLLWPMNGSVIMKFSDTNGIYFQTLGQYRTNPAIMIQGDVDTQVLTAAKCEITDISKNEETGLTVTTSVGDDYEVVYGQLKNVNAEVGDILEEGQVLGSLGEPTKYFVLEGSNLYFKVLENGKAVNPMLLLR